MVSFFELPETHYVERLGFAPFALPSIKPPRLLSSATGGGKLVFESHSISQIEKQRPNGR